MSGSVSVKTTTSTAEQKSDINFRKITFLEEKMQYSKEEKARLLEDWKQSGKSISAYVRENGLVRWTFTKWIKAEREAQQCFVEVPRYAPVPAMQAGLQGPEILIENGNIKIHIPLAIGSSGLRMVMEGMGVTL
jgi:transposase-like protein